MKKLLSILPLLFLAACAGGSNYDDSAFEQIVLREKLRSGTADTVRIHRKAKESYIAALARQQGGKFAESVTDLNIALQADSAAPVLYSLARAYYEMKRLDLAKITLLDAIEKDENFPPAYELLAEVFLAEYRLDESIEVIRKLVSIKPDFRHKLLLAQYYELEEPQQAIALYEELLEDSSDDFLIEKLIDIYERSGDKEKALALQKQLFDKEPYKIANATDLMETFLAKKDYDEATQLLEKIDSLYLDEDLYFFYGMTGSVLVTEQDTVAGKYKRKYLGLLGRQLHSRWQIQFLAGYISCQAGDTVAAMHYFRNALAFTDQRNNLHAEIAEHYYNEKDHAFSLRIIREFSDDSSGTDWRLHYLAGLDSYALKDYAGAGVSLEKALLLKKENIDVMQALAAVAEQVKNYARSDSLYEAALVIDPSSSSVSNNYAYSLAVREKDLDRAMNLVRSALFTSPDNPVYLDTYAWVLHKKGRNIEALEQILKAINYGQANSEVYEHLAEIYISLNKIEDARVSLERSLIIEPKRSSARELLRKLKE